MNRLVLLISLLFFSLSSFSQIKIAQLKYDGGGDWYSNPSSLKNLINFSNQNINTKISLPFDIIDINSDKIFDYPYIFMTGHGNVVFSDVQIERLRKYLYNGGFLHIDDNYGMYKYIMREIKRIFPDVKIQVLPNSHIIFHQSFDFSNGLPKIHEHDGKNAQAFAITHNNRIILLYTYESDLGDGWEDKNVHTDPDELRLKALKMGSNILEYCFTN